MTLRLTSSLLRRALALGTLLAATAALAPAQEESTRPQLSEKTSEQLTKVRTLTEAQNWDGALTVVSDQLKAVPGTSYDAATLLQLKSQIYLQKNMFTEAIAPLAQCLEISEAQGYFEAPARHQMLYYLAQLYNQEGATAKDPAVVQEYLGKAEQSMQRWMKSSPKITAEAGVFYASLLYNRAVSGRDRADPAIIARALEQSEAALRLSGRPPDTLYQLKLACLQQLNRHAESAEVLELLLKHKPDNQAYWQQLSGTYVAAASETKDAASAVAYNVRAILTFERAQQLGFLKTAKDNLNLVGIYFNLQQYGKAIGLLEGGLRNGGIENEQKNWELLAYSYQQVKNDAKAVETFREATTRFPNSGQLEFLAAQVCYSLDRTEDAYAHVQNCLRKGGTDKPHVAQLFLAYLAMELKHYDVALDAAGKAAAYPDGAKEALRMKKVIEDIVAEQRPGRSS